MSFLMPQKYRNQRSITEQQGKTSNRLKLPVLCLLQKQKMKTSRSLQQKNQGILQIIKNFSQREQQQTSNVDFVYRYPQVERQISYKKQIKLKSLHSITSEKVKLITQKVSNYQDKSLDALEFDVYSQDGVESLEEYIRNQNK